MMELISLFPVEIDRFINLLGSVVGIAGFFFGLWRHFEERKVRRVLTDKEQELAFKQRELDEQSDRLKHLQGLTSGLPNYSRAV